MKKADVRWGYVALYYTVALALSVPFNLGLVAQVLNLQAIFPAIWQAWLFVPAALGPLIAGLLCYRLDRKTSRRMSLLGHNRTASLYVALVPLIAFPLLSAMMGGSIAGGFTTLLAVCLAMTYALGEEVGWRGYLQDALSPLSATHRYLIIGILWWAWHARFTNLFEWIAFPLIVVASAFLLGRVAEETRSLLVTATMHAVIMLLTMNGSGSLAYKIAGVLTILGWIWLGKIQPAKPS